MEPTQGDWDDQVLKVSSILEETRGQFTGIIEWNDGDKAKLSLDVVYRMCPCKLGEFCQALSVLSEPQTTLPRGSWEDKVRSVNAIFRTETGEMGCLIVWKNGSSQEVALGTAVFLCNGKVIDCYNRLDQFLYVSLESASAVFIWLTCCRKVD